MAGVLLDTHALYWLVSGQRSLLDEALVSIAENQEAGTLFVSPISAWELALAARKSLHRDRPDLGETQPAAWFQQAIAEISAKLVFIDERIAIEAANVVAVSGHRDPGDCYLIATARVREMSLITRDVIIRDLASSGYLEVIQC